MRILLTLFLLIIFCNSTFSQKISGRVTDNKGQPLPFASLFVKGSSKGTTANSQGYYSLRIENGNYTLVCQHVGYSREEKKVSHNSAETEINFTLSLQEMTLSEVVIKNGEDPAYKIIRNAIRKRNFYKSQLESFRCKVYTKGQLRLRDYPKRIFGQKVDFEDGDTSKQKMIYLSETISTFAVDRNKKEKIEVISSRVSGQSDGFGLAAPRFFSFYENNIQLGSNINPRGFISPIAANALNYYRYKLEGTFFEDGQMVNHIKVTPKRKYEPLFSGYIDIVDGDWRIHSVSLLLTKSAQMELIDTLKLEQVHRPLSKDYWFIASQVVYPSIKVLGFDAYGSFLNVYSDVEPEPVFNKNSFSRTILKYLDSANKKPQEYWESNRPIPLMQEEAADYRKKDSLERAKKDPQYLDSLDQIRNKTSLSSVLFFGESIENSKKRSSITIVPLLDIVFFNPAEGMVLNPEISWSKRPDSSAISRRRLTIISDLRYGFSNRHFNSWLTLHYSYGKKYSSALSLSGGKRVFQFNNNSTISERSNTISCLFYERNRIKSYEAYYLRGSFRKGIGEGFGLTLGFQWQDRRPLDNTTNYTWKNKDGREYSPNYPVELMQANLKPHKSFFVLANLRWQPGTRYIELPDRKINVGSGYPVFNLEYMQAFKDLFGSDVSYQRWKFSVSDNINLKLAGRFGYRLAVGGFIDTSGMQVPDYLHFNGNSSILASDYLNSFQLLPLYLYSNASDFFMQGHLEHNFKGFLTNKLPGIRKLNIYLVTGFNGFYINDRKNYFEIFAGIDNIFKQLRVDFLQSFREGKSWQTGIRLGFNFLAGKRGDDWP